MANNHSGIEKRLWASADELRSDSKLKSSEYSVPVLGLIFLRYADQRFTQTEKELAGKGTGRRAIGREGYQATVAARHENLTQSGVNVPVPGATVNVTGRASIPII